MRIQVLVISAALLGTGALGFVLRHATPASRPPDSSGKVAREVDELTRRLKKLESQRASGINRRAMSPLYAAANATAEPAEVRTASSGAAPFEPSARDDKDPAAIQAREDAAEQRRFLGDELAAEARDANWARAQEGLIFETFAALDKTKFATTRLIRSDCKSTLCAVEWEAGTSKEALDAILSVSRPMGQTYSSSVSDENTGAEHVTMYVARAGHELPKNPDREPID